MPRQFVSLQSSIPNGYSPSPYFYKIETPYSFLVNGQSHYFSKNLHVDNPHLHHTSDKNSHSCNRPKELLEIPHPSVFRCYPSERSCSPRKVISRENLKTNGRKSQKENRRGEATGNVGNLLSTKKKSTLKDAETGYNQLGMSHIKLDCASRLKVPSTTNVSHIITLNARVTSKPPLPAKVSNNNVTHEQMTFHQISKNDESSEVLDVTAITDDTSLWSADAETEFTNARLPKELDFFLLDHSYPRSLSNEYVNKKMSSTVKTISDKPLRDAVNVNRENTEKDNGIKEFDNKRCADLKAEKNDKSASCVTLKWTHDRTEKTNHEIRMFNNNLNPLAANLPKITSSENEMCFTFKNQKNKTKDCRHFAKSPHKKERISKKLMSFANIWKGKRRMEIKHLAEF